MKKRKLKTSVYFIILVFIVLIMSLVILLKNQDEKNVDKSKDNENETTNKVVEEVPKEKRMSLIAVGDILIHESVYKDAYNKETNTYDFHYMFTDIEPIIKKYDLKFCNQESAIGGRSLGISGYPSFNSPDEIGDELVNLGFNLISLANNHTLDKGEDAALYSNSYWKSKNVNFAGSYSSDEERNEVKIYEQNGIKYAFLAYTVNSNAKVRKDYLLNMYSADKAKNDIDKVKDQVDVIIVSMHWGVEDTNTPTESQRQIADYLSSLGVNLIIGHHPHVVQPVEYVNDTLVIYSLGNFISNQLSIRLNNGIGLMYGIDIVVDDSGLRFENEYKELVLAYAEKSTNFKVIPFSKLNNDLLNNYENIEEQYMNIVNGE
ncbi:MAG: CapA family protein [Bacilli bacterium]|nr:CapA family protein [Bacilli bacterium]